MEDRAKPIMWRRDPLSEVEDKLDCSRVLHRQAGLRGFSCMPKRSYIDRGSYYAEINQAIPTGRYYSDQPHIQVHDMRLNVALGTGRTPLLAAVNGFKLVGLNDPVMLTIYLEVELHYLKQAARTYGRLDLALEDLTAIMRSVIVLSADLQGSTVPFVAFDEDDDL